MTVIKSFHCQELPVSYIVKGEHVIGILHMANTRSHVGVLIVVGGRQYRIGAHRQFVKLARDLAGRGTPVFRFDLRGMGDSTGSQIDFLDATPDIDRAIEVFLEKAPNVTEILLWGLCDGATASILSVRNNKIVSSVMMINPWITTERSLARSKIKFYYRDQILNLDFWRKLIRGDLDVGDSIRSFISEIKTVSKHKGSGEGNGESVAGSVFKALDSFDGLVSILISSSDLTAKEFKSEFDRRKKDMLFSKILVSTVRADHTFSSPESYSLLFKKTIKFVQNVVDDK